MNDWNEAELEQYIVDHVPEFVGSTGLTVRLLGRQIPCYYGIIDLLIQVGVSVWLVELKAVPANQKAVGQLQRYQKSILEVSPYQDLTPQEFDLYGPRIDTTVHTVLVAPSITDDAVMGVDFAFIATKNGDEFEFTSTYIPYQRGANAILETVMRPYFVDVLAWHKQARMNMSDWYLNDSAQTTLSYVN